MNKGPTTLEYNQKSETKKINYTVYKVRLITDKT